MLRKNSNISFLYGRTILLIGMISILASCGGSSSATSDPIPDPTPEITSLTTEMFLNNEGWPDHPLHVDNIKPPDEAERALLLSGTLSSPGGRMDTPGYEVFSGQIRYDEFPPFEIQLLSEGQRLIPIVPDKLPNRDGNSFWIPLFGEGRIWQEQDDGYARAQLTVTLVNPFYANAHNGLLTFLYKNGRVTSGWLQIFQENVDWLKQDFVAVLPLAFEDEVIPDWHYENWVQIQHSTSAMTATRPMTDLASIVAPELLANFTANIDENNIAATGVFHDGILYRQEVNTRYGVFPYPSSMRHGVFSIAKSMAAAVAVMYMEQRFPEQVLDAKVTDYIPEVPFHAGWEDVTVHHLLSMATGVGTAQPENIDAPFADETFESDSLLTRFYLAPYTEDKFEVLAEFGNYAWGPGEKVRYNTSYTFVLGAVLQRLLIEQGDHRLLWQVLQQDVFEKMGIYHFPMMHTQDEDLRYRLPLLGVGIYPTDEEAVRIARLFLQNGRWEEEQLLSATLVSEVMNFNQTTGLSAETGGDFAGRRYHLSFWAQLISLNEECQLTVPYMLGYGNNYLLFPGNDTIVYRYQDAFNTDKLGLLGVANALQPMCE